MKDKEKYLFVIEEAVTEIIDAWACDWSYCHDLYDEIEEFTEKLFNQKFISPEQYNKARNSLSSFKGFARGISGAGSYRNYDEQYLRGNAESHLAALLENLSQN